MALFKRNFLAALLALWSASAMAADKVRIVVSVDWEGESLRSENIEAMKKFRKAFPRIPLQHFLNAAYYTKPKADANQVTTTIKSVLLGGDEHGLHLHGWESLMTESGVDFRNSPNFLSGSPELADCEYDCGHEIAIAAYSEAELIKVFKQSKKLLFDHGFKVPKSFRAGGWLATDRVLDALVKSGFTLDASATDAKYIKTDWGQDNLYRWVQQIWPNTTETSQSYIHTTLAGNKIRELPNNGSLADYVEGKEILAAFKANAGLLNPSDGLDEVVYLSIGFHQETAAQFLPRLISGINQIINYAEANNIPYEFALPKF